MAYIPIDTDQFTCWNFLGVKFIVISLFSWLYLE